MQNSSWNNIVIQFFDNSQQWYFLINRSWNQQYLQNTYGHNSIVQFGNVQCKTYLLIPVQCAFQYGEIKFYKTKTYNWDFFERYYGISFKYSSWYAQSLMDAYYVMPQGSPKTWTASYNPSSYKASQIKLNDFSWTSLIDWSQVQVLCPPGYRIAGDNVNCIKCTSGCSECAYYDKTRCYNCSIEYELVNYKCIPIVCPFGKYLNMSTGKCDACISPCSLCLNQTACQSCVSGYLYIDDGSYTCANSCPNSSYIQDPSYPICRICPLNCLKCDSSGVCQSCLRQHVKYNGGCARQCPSNTYYNLTDYSCYSCSANCAGCSAFNCYSCISGSFLNTITWTCAATCPASTYPDTKTGVCMKCQPGCTACNTNNYTCTACAAGYFLYGNACVQRCPYVGFYHDTTLRQCTPCNPYCQICVSSTTDCIMCNPGYLYNNRGCYLSCPPQYYSTPAKQCFSCDPKCLSCTGSLNTMCQSCATGNFLQGSTCDTTCLQSYYADIPTKTCIACKYYCASCTSLSVCTQCLAGYQTIPNDCVGEYYLRTTSSFNLNLPINQATLPTSSVLTQMTAEVWFKADNVSTTTIDVILGLSPFKVRKQASQAKIQLNFQGNYIFCGSSLLQNNTWYHFAFTSSQDTVELNCYLNGISYNIGTNPAVIVSSSLQVPKEVTIGGTIFPLGSEAKFQGYIKEFRLWNVLRAAFFINYFKNIAFTSVPSSLVIYYRLDEKNDGSSTVFKDSSGSGTNVYNPLTATPAFTVASVVEMREIYLKICPEGFYLNLNNLGYYDCLACDSSCRNCIGPTNLNCTGCNNPYKLIQQTFQCMIITSCPAKFFLDPVELLCFPCNQYCQTCIGSSGNCPICVQNSFRVSGSTDCSNNCTAGYYGNYSDQLCYLNPEVTSITPSDSSIFTFGDFIEATANFQMINNESSSTYSYGWIVKRLSTDTTPEVDISVDVIKTYYNTSILRVHLDNNILQPDYKFNISFYVQGNNSLYYNMQSILSSIIYIGTSPKNGLCSISPVVGYAEITEFTLTQTGWADSNPIPFYDFYYSFDKGQIFIPIENLDRSSNSMKLIFPPIYQQVTDVQIKCQATNNKGFQNSVKVETVIQKKSATTASKNLNTIDLSSLVTESDCLQEALQLLLITQSLGSLTPSSQLYFDPRISFSDCDSTLCNNEGACIFIPYSSKYYCNCSNNYAGQNCTFQNSTQLKLLQNLTSNLTDFYVNNLTDYIYQFEFIQLVTSYKEMINDITFSFVIELISDMIIDWQTNQPTDDDLQTYMKIISNLLEYLDHEITVRNVTKSWSLSSSQKSTILANLQQAMVIFLKVRQQTLAQVNELTTSYLMTTKMLTFKQSLLTQQSVISIMATNSIKKNTQTYVTISDKNFMNTSVQLEEQFIAETIEYAINPFELVNYFNMSNNVFEVNFYNYSNKEKVQVQNLTNNFSFYFPLQKNLNLSDFFASYSALSPYKALQQAKRDQMIQNSLLACNYWDGNVWASDGCLFKGFDASHIICQCNHLTAFGPSFITPPVQVSSSNTGTGTLKTSNADDGSPIQLDELLVPFDQYIPNLQELLQHKRPSLMDFLLKPGLYVVMLFWFMYVTSLVYYTGKDRLKRYKMTKKQNRDDLGELHDDQIQCIEQVIQDILIQDHLDLMRKEKNLLIDSKPKIFEELDADNQKRLRRRAKRKVFGKISSSCEKAQRFYRLTYKGDTHTSETKMKFFHEELKNNLWFGLMGKTSKIAPRHVRLTLMYFYSSLYLFITSFIYTFGYQFQIDQYSGDPIFTQIFLSVATIFGIWFITIPVALIFRMPYSIKSQIEGVKTKKINKVFIELDRQMGCRYAIGYFFCLTSYLMMSIMVIFFNYFYPQEYTMSWLFQMVFILVLDLGLFTFAIAGIQLSLSLASLKVKCFRNVWVAFEVMRYLKNLRG